MSEDSRQAVVRRFFEAGWNAGSGTPVSDIVHEDYASNDGGFFRSGSDVPGGLQRLSGANALTHHIERYREIYDDLHFTIDRMTVDADTVTTVWSPSGTTRHERFTDRGGHERPFQLRGQGVSRTDVVDGKVTRHDLFWARDPLFP